MLSLTIDSIVSLFGSLLLFGLIPLIWWFIFHRKKESFFRFVGLKKPKLTKPVWVFIAFIAVYLVFSRYGGNLLSSLFIHEADLQVVAQSGSATSNNFRGLGSAAVPAAIITGLLSNGFCEELMYRGFILKRFKARIGAVGAIVLTAALFSLMHNALILLAGISVSFSYHVGTFLFPFIGALLLGYANEILFDGSIWPSILLHGIGNAISFVTAAYN